MVAVRAWLLPSKDYKLLSISNSVKAAIFLSFASLFWSGNFIIGRLASLESLVSPLSLGFYRWLIAFIILTPFCFQKAKTDIFLIKKQPWLMFLIILTGPTLFNTFVYIGLSETTVINALLVNSAIPMFIIFSQFAMCLFNCRTM